MKLQTINTGFFKLDGGAMFGVVPKQLWNKLNPADNLNLCTWAMRCLLIEDGEKLMLIDNGIGDKQSDKFFSHYHLDFTDTLEGSLKTLGFGLDEITDNILSHLHFDHAGGGIIWNKDRTAYEPTFPNAHYWTTQKHWHNALNPNRREGASFLKENLLPMQESGHLKFLDDVPNFHPAINFEEGDGHTEGMLNCMIDYKGTKVCFVADLFPSLHHIPPHFNMGYDVQPLKIMDEKQNFLERAAANGWVLFFEHDPVNECCTVEKTEKGFRPKEVFKLDSITT
ncbi:MAG: MBL fold metallo-hydrolase [Flavobacteriaceae bacterium]|nr:MBL fold metallo-hydrolase [Flavobacteriaceae bacterium]